VAAFLASESKTAKPSTLGRRIATIRYAHKLAHLYTPTDSEAVKATLRGIRRTFGGAKVRKSPAVAAKMHSMVATAPDRVSGLRDRALLLLGFAGAFRRSELVALDVADVAEAKTGLLVTIRRTDARRRSRSGNRHVACGRSRSLLSFDSRCWRDEISEARCKGSSDYNCRNCKSQNAHFPFAFSLNHFNGSPIVYARVLRS
jgi:hypothetical protein